MGGKKTGNKDPMEDLRIKKLVFDHSERLAVASFESLGVPSSESMSAASADIFGIKEGILKPSEEVRMKRILAMDVPIQGDRTFRYEGSTPYDSDDSYLTFAAVLNEETGEATLYPADVFHMMPRSGGYGDHPWRLRMDIPENLATNKDQEKTEEGEKKKAKKRTNITDLSKSFGTSAKQRKQKEMGQNRDITAPTAGHELDQIVEAAPKEDRRKKAAIPGDDSGILPPMNLDDPPTPRDVLDDDDLIPPDLLELILAIPDVQKILEKDDSQFQKWRQLEAFPKWFLSAIDSFSLDETRRKRQVTFSYFALTLFNLVTSKSDVIRKKNASLPESWPIPLVRHLLDNFTQINLNQGRRNRVMPTVLKDKAILYAIFILLIANDFCFSCGEFFSELTQFTDSRIHSLCTLGRLTSYTREGIRWLDLRTPLPEFHSKDKDRASRKRKL